MALKKSKKANESPPEEGVAALAAKAALKKSKKANESPPEESIADLAAKAALRKSEKGDESSPAEGIAALAAKAALKKSEKGDECSPAEGITDLAAETALKLYSKEAHDMKEVLPEPQVGGIAALAAQATLDNSKVKATAEKNPQQTSLGGIASLVSMTANDTSDTRGLKLQDFSRSHIGEIANQTSKTALEGSEIYVGTEDSHSKTAFSDISKTELEIFEEKPALNDHPQQMEGNTSSVAIHARLETSEKLEPNVDYSIKLGDDMPGLTTPGVLDESSKQSIPKGVPLTSVASGMSSLTAQAATETTSKVPLQEKTPKDLSIGEMSSLAAQVASEITDKPIKNPDKHKTSGISSLAIEVGGEIPPTSLLKQRESDRSPNGEVAVEKSSTPSPKEKGPNRSPIGGMTSLATQAAMEKTQRISPTGKLPNSSSKRSTPQPSPTAVRSSLAMALEKVKSPSSPNKSPKRSPTGLMSSLAAALDKAKQQDANRRKGPSLGSFFERNSSQEIRREILRQNNDDSSVARMAENLQKEQIHGTAWNQEEGISDYIGWANRAIRTSDTESVRDFESARDMLYDDQSTIATGMDDSTHYTNFDDGTIATNFDDDASFATNMTPKNDKTYSGGGSEYYNSEQYNNYSLHANDPYSYTMATDSTQNPYGDAVINVPLEFNQEQGMQNGLSFGGDDGFDGPGEYGSNEMMRGGVYDDGLGGFGRDAGHGGFGLASPTTLPQNQVNHFTITSDNAGLGGFGLVSPSTRQTNTSNNYTITPPPAPAVAEGDAGPNRPWGASPKATRKDEDRSRSRHWSDNAHNKATNRSKKIKTATTKTEEDSVVFRGWGAPPKQPDQPTKRKNWFGF